MTSHPASQVTPAGEDTGHDVARQALDGAAGRSPDDDAGQRAAWRRRSRGQSGRLGAAALAVARTHWLAVGLLAAGLGLRVVAQLAYRPALFYIDTVRYLYNADGMDPVGYKAPLRAILFVANFDAVAAVQHLLGLAMAVLIYVLVLQRGGPRWLAALAMAPVLLDAYQLQNEQAIMPGTWFEALIVAGIALLLWRPELSWRRVAAAGVLLGASATVAQVGEALLLPAVIYLFATGGWRKSAAKAAAFCLAFAAPILGYCTGSLLLTGDFFLSHTGATSYYGRMAAAADCTTLRLPPAERGMCPTPAQQASGPDWLEYNPRSPIRPYYAGLPRDRVDALLSDFNHRVLAQQPLRVLGAYSRDVLKLFAPARTQSQGDTPISRWQFQTSYPYFASHATRPIVDTAIRRFGGGAPAVWAPAAAFLRSYQLDGGYAPGPLLALFAAGGLAGSVLAFRRRGGSGTRQLALGCLLFFGAAAFLLGVSDTFEFSWRYQLPALVTLAPGGALGIGAVLAAIRDRRQPADAPASGG
jgi:hypothetical protein